MHELKFAANMPARRSGNSAMIFEHVRLTIVISPPLMKECGGRRERGCSRMNPGRCALIPFPVMCQAIIG
jgi:hypothetical protein